MPPEYRDATDTARTAAARNRKPTWALFSLSHVNALLIGLRKIKYGNQTYEVILLMNAVENYAYGIIAQACLTYEKFNLAIGPIASVLAPELFAEEQDWMMEAIYSSQFSIPYRPPSYRIRKPKKTDEDNLIELVDNLVREAVATQAPAPPPLTVHPVESKTDDSSALAIMLAGSEKS